MTFKVYHFFLCIPSKKISGISFYTRWNKIFFIHISHIFYCIYLLLWLKFHMLSRDLHVILYLVPKKSEEIRQATRVFRFFSPFPWVTEAFCAYVKKGSPELCCHLSFFCTWLPTKNLRNNLLMHQRLNTLLKWLGIFVSFAYLFMNLLRLKTFQWSQKMPFLFPKYIYV